MRSLSNAHNSSNLKLDLYENESGLFCVKYSTFGFLDLERRADSQLILKHNSKILKTAKNEFFFGEKNRLPSGWSSFITIADGLHGCTALPNSIRARIHSFPWIYLQEKQQKRYF